MKKLTWDTTFSTYYWELHYKDGKREKSDGYSKVLNQQENADKIRLLCRCIKNPMFQQGYIPDKCKEVVIRKKISAMIRKDQDPVIVVLTPTGYHSLDSNYVPDVVKNYLDELYRALLTGEVPKESCYPNQIRQNKSVDEIWRASKATTFFNYQDFHTVKLRLASMGCSEGMVQAFVNEIQRKQPEIFRFAQAIPDPERERKLTPIDRKEFYGHTKSELQAASDQVKQKYDIKNLPAGVTLKSLLQAELLNANKNINQQNQST